LEARRVFLAERIADGMISSVVTFIGATTNAAGAVPRGFNGRPCTLTLYDILQNGFQCEARNGVVYAVENPNVFDALFDPLTRSLRSDNLPTLVCLDGNFSHACESLLEVLLGSAATLKFSTDEDAGGRRIRRRLKEKWPTSSQLQESTMGPYEEQNVPEILRAIARDLQAAGVGSEERRRLLDEAELIERSRG
jgi:hypothetical protein